MSLHLYSCTFTPQPKRADVRVSQKTRLATRRRLEAELAEERISAELVEKHNRHARDSQQFREQGETA